jgi:hypothetical protein
MGKVFGKVTDAIGLTDYEGQEQAAKQAGFANAQQYKLTQESIKLQKETLEFQKEQYEDWQNIYGDIQENLGEYYSDLNPDDLTALGLQNQQREFQRAVKTMEREAAQRGISGSGIEYAAKSTATFQNAEARARIRTEADERVAEQKLGFLGIGLNQGQNMLGNINQASSNVNQAYGTGINSYTSTGNAYRNQYTNISGANMDAAGQVVGTVAGFIGG